jgi:homeobox protein cut-like
MQATVESLDNERGFLNEQIKSLQIQLAETPSKEKIDNMRRELRILKKLEYNAVDVDEQEEPEMTTSGAGDDTDDLEAILITKLRKAEADLLVERREKNGLSSNCKELKEKITVLKKEKDEADALTIRLESDLEKAIVAPTTSLSVKQIPDLPANPGVDGSTLQQILDPTSKSSKIATSNTTAIKSNSASDKQEDDHSVATIVMAQRDRLRARCDALEAERDSFKRELQVQVSTSESLKSDNTKLYEKVRYFQNFNSHSGQSLGALHSRNKGALADRDLDLEALEQRYEASVDPFRQFSRAERQRKLNEMSPMERIVFIVARTVLGSKEMRTFLFFYVVGMHLLVFSTTYHWSHGCSSGPDYEAISSMQRGVPIIEEQP